MKVLNSETYRIEPGLIPQDLNGGVISARLDLEAAAGASVMLMLEVAVGIATTLDVTLEQHDAAAAGTSKALIPLTVHAKAASKSVYSSVAVASNLLVPALDLEAGILLIEVRLSDVDTEAGFKWISLTVANPAAAKLGSCSYHIDCKFEPAHDHVIA